MEYTNKKGTDDLFLGLSIYAGIGLITGVLASFLLGYWALIITLIIIIIGFFMDFDKVEKNTIASVKNYNDDPKFNRGNGYLWLRFGLFQIHKTYKYTDDVSTQEIKDALTKTGDDKRVSCKFQTTTRITNPLLLEDTLGFDNFESELEKFRANKFEEFIRLVSLKELETSGQDNLNKKTAEKDDVSKQSLIIEHHKRCGISVVGNIEVLDISADIEIIREEKQKEKERQEVLETSRSGFMYRVSKRHLTSLVRESSSDKTEDGFIEEAKNSLDDDAEKDVVLRKAVKLAEITIANKKILTELLDKAKKDQELYEGKFSKTVLEGAEGGRPFLNIPIGGKK